MSNFIIYPAIDLHKGRVVRLKQGDRNKSEIYNLDPSQAAKKWINQGAKWLHVINLDGAFGEDSRRNIAALRKIIAIAKDKAAIQFGGGLRSMETIREILSLGVSRVIVGTAAVEHPDLIKKALDTFGPDKIVLGVDARDGFVRVGGWEEKTNITIIELASGFISSGLETIIYTNIKHDGMQNGVDIKTAKELVSATNLEVIASGGVGTLEDIQEVKMAGFSGVVVGKALYENKFTLLEAIDVG